MKYTVYGYLTISVVAEIEASSKEEASRKALQLDPPGLCCQCDNAGNGVTEWQLNGWDDPPDDAAQHLEES